MPLAMKNAIRVIFLNPFYNKITPFVNDFFNNGVIFSEIFV